MNERCHTRVFGVMQPRSKRVGIIALAVVAAVSGCAPIEPSPADESPTPSSMPSATLDSSADELTANGDPLPAGTYTRAAFTPAITFDLDGSWQAVQLFDGFFDVQQDIGSPDVMAVQFARPSGVYGTGVTSEVPNSPEHAVELLGANSGLTVLESSESRIGGLTGSQVTVENAGNGHARVMQVPVGALGIDPGRRLWIAFFDAPDGLLAIMVGGSDARWEETLAAAEPVLESIRIGK